MQLSYAQLSLSNDTVPIYYTLIIARKLIQNIPYIPSTRERDAVH